MKKQDGITWKDKVLSINDRIRFQFRRLYIILQMLPWDRIIGFLNQSGAKDQIEKRVKDTFKPKE